MYLLFKQKAHQPNLPGPPPIAKWLGYLGNRLSFWADPIKTMCDLHETYGSIAALDPRARQPRMVFAFDPAYNYQLANESVFAHGNPFNRLGRGRSALKRLTTGLITMNGSAHKAHRRMLLPAFQKEQVAHYHQTMVQFTQQMLDSWQPGATYDLAAEMHSLTTKIVGGALFGLHDIDAAIRTSQMVRDWLRAMDSGSVLLFPYPLPGTDYWRLRQQSIRIEHQLQHIIAQYRLGPRTPGSVLDSLIQIEEDSGQTLTEAEILGHLNLLFVAGQETSAAALTWTLFLLEQHPAILSDLVDELSAVLRGVAPTAGDLQRLPLLSRVIKESLRLIPPAPYSIRMTTEHVTLGSYVLPPGTDVLLSSYVTHHLPELYVEPERFNPARWETITPSPYEYLPFGVGARMCLGARFATMELQIVLAMVLQRYRIALQAGTVVNRYVRGTLSIEGGLPITIVHQDHAFKSTAVTGNVHEMVELEA